MMLKRIGFRSILLFLFLVLASSTTSGEDLQIDYKEYTVLKGDTLWDISSKEFEEKDPFLWPKLWKENLQIKNPDLIYPGQIIKIPLKLLKKEQPEAEEATTEKEVEVTEPAKVETKEEELAKAKLPKVELHKEVPPKAVEKKIKPVTKRYIIEPDILIASGYITDYIAAKVKSVGKITGAPSGRTLFGREDYVYIKTDTPSNTGDKYYIIRSVKRIKHPKTNKKLGYLIEVLGVTEVVGTEDGMTKALITKSYSDVRIGDLLDTFYEIEPAIEEDQPRMPDVSGFIVATRQMRTITGYMDILFIDKGTDNGLESGDLLKATIIDRHTNSRSTGVIQIINLKNTTASAIVQKSEDAITIGTAVSGLK